MSKKMFIGAKERHFIQHLTKELIQEVVGQKVIYYSISDEHTHSNDLYSEAIIKTAWNPVELNARVMYLTPEQTQNQFTIETVYQIEIYFQLKELEERNVIPREGDYCKFGDKFYEILSLIQDQPTFGQIEQQIEVKAKCRMARDGQFNINDEPKLQV